MDEQIPRVKTTIVEKQPSLTGEALEFMLHVFDDERAQTRQSEDQRSAITGLVVVIASAIQGALTQTGIKQSALPLTITLIVLGLLGAIACQKLYERFDFHIHRSRKIRSEIETFYPNTRIRAILDTAGKEHEAKYPILYRKIRLHNVWLTLHILIAVSGVIYTAIAIFR